MKIEKNIAKNMKKFQEHIEFFNYLIYNNWQKILITQYVLDKIYTDFIHNLLKFFTNFLIDFQNFRDVFPNISLIFYQNFNKYYSKANTFSNFRSYFLDNSSVSY